MGLYCSAGHVLSQGSTNYTSIRPGKKNHLSGSSLWWRRLLTTKEGGKKEVAGRGDVHEGTLSVASFSPKYPFTILALQINKNSGEHFKKKFRDTISRKKYLRKTNTLLCTQIIFCVVWHIGPAAIGSKTKRLNLYSILLEQKFFF